MSNPRGNVVPFVLPAEMHQAKHFTALISQHWAALDEEIATHMWSPRAERPHRSEVCIDDLVARVGSRLPIFLATGRPMLDNGDIIRYHQRMSDVLIRDLPDDVLAGIDARAAELGLSRVEYIRRRLAQDARAPRVPVTRDDLHRFGQAVAGLADDDLMRQAWQ